MYMVCTRSYIFNYKHVCTLFRHVCTRLYHYRPVSNFINMYIPCTILYIQCTSLYMQFCTADVPITDRYVHYMKCTDIVELCTYTDVFF